MSFIVDRTPHAPGKSGTPWSAVLFSVESLSNGQLHVRAFVRSPMACCIKVAAFACRTLGSCDFEIVRGQLELARARRLARVVGVGWLCQPFTLSALRKQVGSLCERPVLAVDCRG